MRTFTRLGVAAVTVVALTACTSDDPVAEDPTPTPTAEVAESEPTNDDADGFAVPAPDQNGEWGDFALSGVDYLAVARSCRAVSADVADTAMSFEVADGATNNVLRVELVTQNGEEYGVEVHNALAADGEDPIASGTAVVQSEDMDHTFAEGTFEDGSAFTFSFVISGTPDC